MKKTNILFLLCLLLTAAGAAAAPSEADFKKLEKEYILHADGQQEFRCRKELKLNTHIAFNSLYGETFIVYNPQYQTLKIHSAYTQLPNGKRIEVPANAYNEVLPYAAADAPAYNHLREMVVTHTALELGATIYLDYSVYTKPGYFPELDLDEVLQERSPVREYTVTITVPENKPLTYSLTGSRSKPAIKRDNGNVQYRWTLRNIPAASQAPFLPLDNPDVPRLSASTYPSTKEALARLHATFDSPLSPANQAWLKNLIKDKANDTEKIDAIRFFVLYEIETCPVSLEETGYRLRSNDEVIASAYGTQAEKTNLLISLFNAAGFSTKLLVAYPPAHTNGLKSIREMAISCQQNYSAYRSQVAMTARGKLDKVFALLPNQVVDMQLNEQKNINVDRQDKLTDEEIALAGKQGYLVKSIRLTSHESAGNWRNINKLNSRRTEMMELPRVHTEKYTMTLTLPEGFSVETPAQDIRIDRPSASLQMTIRTEGSQVLITRSLELKQQQISPSEYPAFRSLLNTWLSESNNQLILKKKEKGI